jgi:formylglycine-generating enzyme required for sulfatase activity
MANPPPRALRSGLSNQVFPGSRIRLNRRGHTMINTMSQEIAPSQSMRDMIWIPGGSFHMGSERFYPEERPVREVTVAVRQLRRRKGVCDTRRTRTER